MLYKIIFSKFCAITNRLVRYHLFIDSLTVTVKSQFDYNFFFPFGHKKLKSNCPRKFFKRRFIIQVEILINLFFLLLYIISPFGGGKGEKFTNFISSPYHRYINFHYFIYPTFSSANTVAPTASNISRTSSGVGA